MITICGVKISPFSGSCSCSRSILGDPGAVIRVGRKDGTKVFITGERAPGYRLSPDHFQKFKRSRLLIGHKKMLCIIVPNRRTHLNGFFSCVCTVCYGSIYSRFGYMVTSLQFSLIVFYTLILFIFNGFCFVVSWDKDLVIHLK